MLASNNATPAKIPSNHIINRALPGACAHDRVHHLRDRNRNTGIYFSDRGLHQSGDRIEFKLAADCDISEWKVFLGPRPIKFHFRQFGDSL